MILTVGVLILMIGKVNKNVIHTKQTEMSQDTLALLREQQSVDRQISVLSGRIECVNGILNSRRDLEWAGVLNDIRRVTPKTVCITSFSGMDSARMIYLKGLALSHEAIYLFVNMLNKSQRLESAVLIGTEKNNDSDGLISYAINCYLPLGNDKVEDRSQKTENRGQRTEDRKSDI
jgi:Tfp pilus assembly protein PilN